MTRRKRHDAVEPVRQERSLVDKAKDAWSRFVSYMKSLFSSRRQEEIEQH